MFICKAVERGDAVASLSETNVVRWAYRQVGLPNYQRVSTLDINQDKMEVEMVEEVMKKSYNKSLKDCSNEEIYFGLLKMTKEMAADKVSNEGKKKVYYVSAEFLIGKLLSNNLINLGVFADVKKELEEAGAKVELK